MGSLRNAGYAQRGLLAGDIAAVAVPHLKLLFRSARPAIFLGRLLRDRCSRCACPANRSPDAATTPPGLGRADLPCGRRAVYRRHNSHVLDHGAPPGRKALLGTALSSTNAGMSWQRVGYVRQLHTRRDGATRKMDRDPDLPRDAGHRVALLPCVLAGKEDWPPGRRCDRASIARHLERERGGPKTPNRPRTSRYQRVLIAAVEAAPANVSVDDRVWLQGQAANALREMGEFAAAERMRKRAEDTIPQTTRPALATYLQNLKIVIARKDRGDEPLDMIPEVQAAIFCKRKTPQDDFSRTYCGRPEIVKVFAS